MKKYIASLITVFTLALIALPLIAHADQKASLNDEIIYDIIVDRFNNGRQAPSDQVDVKNPLTYNGGDIKGITMMLDSIEEHGFTTISLSPIMENAPSAYHGYLIEDFLTVEDEFGSLEDLQELVEEAHKREIKVFIELVTNYAAKSNPLVEAEASSDWFTEVKAEQIDSTVWLEDAVQFDQRNEDAQAYLIDVANYWMDETDIDGYVLHATDQMDESFLTQLTEHIKEKNPKFYLIAESLQGANLEHLCSNEGLDAIAHQALYEKINEVFAKVDSPVSELYDLTKQTECDKMLLFADNKNTARFSNVFADEGRNAVTTWTLTLAYLYL